MKKRRSFLRRRGSRSRRDSKDDSLLDAAQQVAREEEDNQQRTAHSPLHHDTAPPLQAELHVAAARKASVEEDKRTPQQIHQEAEAVATAKAVVKAEKGTPQQIHPEHPHQPVMRRYISVNDACEEIWKCQEPKQAASWLELLHHALLRTRLDTYIPSEVFLCISGAALRFQDQESAQYDMHVLWSVWEEAMWAAAALARVCVGAAWRQQLLQRDSWIHAMRHQEDDGSASSAAGESSTPRHHPLDEVSTGSMPRSFSPMTSSLDAATNPPQFDRWYPAIPENLPAAMLRFAAIESFIPECNDEIQHATEQRLWLDRRKSLAEAQRELVLALCYILPEEMPDDPDAPPPQLKWTILEAHDPVASMVRFWLESSSTTWPADEQTDASSTINREPTRVSRDESILMNDSENDDITHSLPSVKSTESRRSAAVTNDHSAHSTRYSFSRESTGGFNRSHLKNREIDWWSTLQVVRAAFHLVSAGWRLPESVQAEEIVAYLLESLEKGMTLRAVDLKSDSAGDAREERLAASSSALAALSVLSTVASVGLILYNMQRATVRTLCRLQVATMDWHSFVAPRFPSCSPRSQTEEDEWTADYNTFLEHVEDCVSDLATVQWVLFAHSTSAATSMTTLLDMMQLGIGNDRIPRPVPTEMTRAEVVGLVASTKMACVALNTISAALWGNPPDIPGITSLRLYWLKVFGALNSLASYAHGQIVQFRGAKAGEADAAEHDTVLNGMYALILEVIVALERFTDFELLRGECLLPQDEWDLLVRLLDENINKWLCVADFSPDPRAETDITHETRSETVVLLEQLRQFLESCSQMESNPLSLVLDDDCRVKLYTALLRKAVPNMPPDRGTSLAVAVVRSWSATDFVLHRIDKWAATASMMVEDAFAVFADHGFGLYGGYVHSPCVRLEALKSIAHGVGDEQQLMEPEPFRMTQQPSPLARTTYLREQHLALVNGTVLPLLTTLFDTNQTEIDIFDRLVLPIPDVTFSSREQIACLDLYGANTESVTERVSGELSELPLQRFALNLVGRLFRDVAVERDHRSCFLQMLRSAAINETVRVVRSTLGTVNDWIAGDRKDNAFPDEFYTSLEAIQELENCMCLPFRALPLAHDSLPPVIDVLCSVLVIFGSERGGEPEVNAGSWLVMKRCLAISALLKLARLGSTHDGRLILHQGCDVTRYIPSSLSPLLKESTSKVESSYSQEQGLEPSKRSTVAPFIVVSTGKSESPRAHGSSSRTEISFFPIMSTVLSTIRSNLESKQSRDEASVEEVSAIAHGKSIEELDSKFRALCYDVLRSFMQNGVDFPFATEFISLMNFVEEKDTDLNVFLQEDQARCRCASAVASLLVDTSIPDVTDADYPPEANELFGRILLYCRSSNRQHVLTGCTALSGIIVGFVSDNMATCGMTVFETVLNRLKLELQDAQDCAEARSEVTAVTETLASVLCDLSVCASRAHSGSLASKRILEMIEPFVELCMSRWSQQATGGIVYLRLIAILLNLLRDSDRTSLRSIFDCCSPNSPKIVDRVDKPVESALDGGISQANILVDLIAQKLLPCQPLPNSSGLSSLTYHELLAKETDDISRFIVENSDGKEEHPCAAWLCGESALLTCRIGSSKSRYRSWLEIVVRSPTSRKRRMVRLPSDNSLECPELPSTLWHDPMVQMPATNTISGKLSVDRFTKPSEAMKKAQSLIEKFDDVFSETSGEIQMPATSTISGKLSVDRFKKPSEAMKKAQSLIEKFDDVFSETSGDVKPLLSMSAGEEESPSITKPKTASAAKNADTKNDHHDEGRTVLEWLHRVLRDPESVECVVRELSSLGFPHRALGYLESPAQTPINDALSSYFDPVQRLSVGPKVDRAISILNRIPPFGTHKIALLYATDAVAPDGGAESLEDTVMSATAGSPQFLNFVEGLGKFVLTRHLRYYSGGLDTSGSNHDGKLAVIWLGRDDCFARSMVVFHVVPLMPEGPNNRKRHVGNDNVHILYVEPGCKLDLDLRGGMASTKVVSNIVSGQFGFVIIFVETLRRPNLLRVTVRLRDGLSPDIQTRLEHLVGDHIVSDLTAPIVVRQLAIRADVVCRTIMEDQFGKQNWEERQNQISAMKRYVVSS